MAETVIVNAIPTRAERIKAKILAMASEGTYTRKRTPKDLPEPVSIESLRYCLGGVTTADVRKYVGDLIEEGSLLEVRDTGRRSAQRVRYVRPCDFYRFGFHAITFITGKSEVLRELNINPMREGDTTTERYGYTGPRAAVTE